MGWFEDRHSLKQAREQLGLSQRALSELAGIPKWVIADFESGRRQMKQGPKLVAVWSAITAMEVKREAERYREEQETGRTYLWRLVHTPPREGERLTGYRAFREHQEESNQQKAQSEQIQALTDLVKIHKRIDQTSTEIIESQKELIAELQKELSREGSNKDTRIAELEARVRDLRELYEAGTIAELARERYEQLRDKVSASSEVKEKVGKVLESEGE